MKRENIRGKLQEILQFNELGQYKKVVEKENLGYVVEEIVNYDRVNGRLDISYALSNNSEIKVLKDKENYVKAKTFVEIYTGIRPEIVESYVFGDVENPGFYDGDSFYEILDEFDYELISEDIKNRYELDENMGGSIITYYSPEMDIIGFNVYKDITLGILYYDLFSKEFIKNDKNLKWIKVSIEEI